MKIKIGNEIRNIEIIDGEKGTIIQIDTIQTDISKGSDLKTFLKTELKVKDPILLIEEGKLETIFLYNLNKENDPTIGEFKSYTSTLQEKHKKEHFLKHLADSFFKEYQTYESFYFNLKNFNEWLKKIENELMNQMNSIEIVYKNYQKYASIQTYFEKYKEKFEKETEYFDKVFEKIPADLERLEKSELCAQLIADKRRTLLDCLGQKSAIEKFVSDSLKNYNLLKEKFKVTYSFYEQLLKLNEKLIPPKISLDQIQECVKKVSDDLKLVEPFYESFKFDYEDIIEKMNDESLLNKTLQGDGLNSKEEVHKVASQNLEKVLKVKDYVDKIIKIKQDSNMILSTFLKSITDAEFALKKISQFQKQEIVFDHFKKSGLSQVNLIHLFEDAYYIALAEMSRRSTFMNHYQMKLQQSGNQINSFLENEKNKRKIFNKKIGKYLPDKMFDGLTDDPPQFHLSINELDSTQFLNFDFSKIEISKEKLKSFITNHQEYNIYTSSELDQSTLDLMSSKREEFITFGTNDQENLVKIKNMLFKHLFELKSENTLMNSIQKNVEDFKLKIEIPKIEEKNLDSLKLVEEKKEKTPTPRDTKTGLFEQLLDDQNKEIEDLKEENRKLKEKLEQKEKEFLEKKQEENENMKEKDKMKDLQLENEKLKSENQKLENNYEEMLKLFQNVSNDYNSKLNLFLESQDSIEKLEIFVDKVLKFVQEIPKKNEKQTNEEIQKMRNTKNFQDQSFKELYEKYLKNSFK